MRALKRGVIVLSLAAAACLPGVVLLVQAAGPTLTQKYRDQIIRDHDPSVAKALLADDSLQAALRAEDAAAYKDIFLAAARLKDFCDLFDAHSEPRSLRRALTSRDENEFSRDPKKLIAWTEKYLARDDANLARAAVWDWGSLDKGQKDWLAGQKVTQPAWSAWSFSQRHEKMRQWAKPVLDRLMRASPKIAAQLESMRLEAWGIEGALSYDESNRLWERYNKAKLAVRYLDEARKRLGDKLKDPKLSAFLDSAKTASDLDATLRNLSRLFENAGSGGVPELRAAAPPKPDQVMTPQDKATMAAMFETALMDEIAGTCAGDQLSAFYKTRKLHITVERLPSAIAKYRDKTITFNDKFIEEWLKGEGLGVKQLLGPGDAFARLTRQLSSVFVHEAVHHMQDAWARENGIIFYGGQNIEIEAMELDALFVAEKLRRDKRFKEQFEATQGRSLLARQALTEAVDIEKSPANFRYGVIASYYPEINSLEANIWEFSARNRRMAAEAGIWDFSAWSQRMAAMFHQDFESKAPQAYAKYRDRLARVNADVEKRLKELRSGKPPAPKGPEVPAPK